MKSDTESTDDVMVCLRFLHTSVYCPHVEVRHIASILWLSHTHMLKLLVVKPVSPIACPRLITRNSAGGCKGSFLHVSCGLWVDVWKSWDWGGGWGGGESRFHLLWSQQSIEGFDMTQVSKRDLNVSLIQILTPTTIPSRNVLTKPSNLITGGDSLRCLCSTCCPHEGLQWPHGRTAGTEGGVWLLVWEFIRGLSVSVPRRPRISMFANAVCVCLGLWTAPSEHVCPIGAGWEALVALCHWLQTLPGATMIKSIQFVQTYNWYIYIFIFFARFNVHTPIWNEIKQI